ncbi:MAG TPA: TrkA C-terminal domain-containing protein, partial [Jatrophihabitans sp.]|nr:TrkA C-terminal domain-containing protein [Jatrophihabitans sp.]
AEAWRDPSGAVALIAVTPHEGWVGKPVSEFESATGTRAALFTRFGTGQLPQSNTLIQSGDTLHVLATDERRDVLRDVAGRAPEAAS